MVDGDLTSALRRMAAWLVAGPSGRAILHHAAAELDRLRGENTRLTEGIMRCVDAGWRPNCARDWTRPELILAEYVSDIRARAEGEWCGGCDSWRHTQPCGRDECPADNQRMAKKRGYSREFTPQTERRVQFLIDRIPPTLLEAVKTKAKREGISLRALTLQLWKEWAQR